MGVHLARMRKNKIVTRVWDMMILKKKEMDKL